MPPMDLMSEFCADPARYVDLRNRLRKFFDWRGCDDPEDLADETIARAARRIAEGAVSDGVLQYCYGVAKLVLREYRRRPRKTENLDEFEEDMGAVDARETIDTKVALEQCLRKLPPHEAELLLEYFRSDRSRLADRLGISANALRVRVYRILTELRELAKGPKPEAIPSPPEHPERVGR